MNILERLQNEVLTGDGALGTMLYAKGVGLETNFEHLNLVQPFIVLDLAKEYVAAGAQVIETNTFGANFSKLNLIGLGHKVADINIAGARIARSAAKEREDILVAGSMGPLTRVKGEEKEYSSEEITEYYRVQSHALASGGVDFLLLETFYSLKQLLNAVLAAKETKLPVCAQMAFFDGRSGDGTTVEAFCDAMEKAGADMIGANCGAGPLELLKVVQKIAARTDKPITAYANSGFPEYLDGRYIYRATPAYFASMAIEMADAGTNLIGGCCGTTPEHVAAIAKALAGRKPAKRVRVQVTTVIEKEAGKPEKVSSFLDEWRQRKIITVELDPPKGTDCSSIIEKSKRLKPWGVDAINIAENPLAKPRMGNIALGSIIQRESGIEVIVHITGRDRNLIGMQSDLMGASLLGIRTILAVTGDPATLGDHAGATSVFDLNSFSLIKLLSDLNKGVNAIGHSIGKGTGFTIGAAFNPHSKNLSVQVERLRKKKELGAIFCQTQPMYDPELFRSVLRVTSNIGIPVIPGIMPLLSERNAEYLHNEVPGISIPEDIRKRMKGKEKEAGMQEGITIAREFIKATIHEAGGYYLIPPFGNIEVVEELIKHIHRLEKTLT
ncbi:MAG: bifunctional homocysteine S-methyltransferase/methylenetetrahydrofolate reductase [Nitrospirota bacterium]